MSVKCSSLCGQYKLYVMLCRCQNGTASQYVMAHCVAFLKIASWQHLTFGCQPLTDSSMILAEHMLCLRWPIWIELAAQTCTQFLPTAVPFSANSLKHFFSQSTDVHRALETFDDALYKFIFYITLHTYQQCFPCLLVSCLTSDFVIFGFVNHSCYLQHCYWCSHYIATTKEYLTSQQNYLG